jgi:hypothetical protein
MAINEADFADPISRRLARGEAVSPKAQIWLDPKGQETVSPRSGGIEDPVRYDIPEDTMLYRFASVSDGAEGAMRGGWWLERHELDQLINFARSNDRSLGYAVRLLCCVPPEWGKRTELPGGGKGGRRHCRLAGLRRKRICNLHTADRCAPLLGRGHLYSRAEPHRRSACSSTLYSRHPQRRRITPAVPVRRAVANRRCAGLDLRIGSLIVVRAR